MTPELQKLLERYHDREVSPDESTEVEALLERDVEALEYLGGLDEMTELVQTAVDMRVSTVSFEGFWDGVSTRIQEEEEMALARKTEASEPGFAERLMSWLKAIFVENKGAWITAAATAAAVALVLSFMNPPANNVGGPEVATSPKVVEKHFIYVDSVENPDKESMVLVNSIEDKSKGDTKVIWLLPSQDDEPQAEDDEDDGIEIVDEPL